MNFECLVNTFFELFNYIVDELEVYLEQPIMTFGFYYFDFPSKYKNRYCGEFWWLLYPCYYFTCM